MARNNICNCPNPPGGQVVCELHQMAVCIVRNGQSRQQCLDPLRTKDSVILVNWALEQITEIRRGSHSIIERQDLEMLTNGIFRNYNTTVTFKLPQSIILAIKEIKDDDKEQYTRDEEHVTA